MQRGDLILTPTGLWHEHGHDGTGPVVWLDAGFAVGVLHRGVLPPGGAEPEHQAGEGVANYARGGLRPTPVFERSNKAYPMLRYPWSEARAALLAIAA